MVGEGQIPISGDEHLIEEIKSREKDRLVEFEESKNRKVGDEIEVTAGPLKGLRGVLKREILDNKRVVTSIMVPIKGNFTSKGKD